MRPTNFTEKEKELIRKTLIQRNESYQKNEVPEKFEKHLKETLKKIDSDFDNYYSKNHKTQITSCINEFLKPHENRISFYFNLPSIKFTALSTQEKEEIELFDLCFSILEKTGFRKSETRFLKILEKIEKLKNSDKIFISRTDKKNVYKIAFINKNELMKWELNSPVDLIHEDFLKQTKKQIDDYSSGFTDSVSKLEAKEIINNCSPVTKNQETFEFVKYLVN